jgi:hypothetical protein
LAARRLVSGEVTRFWHRATVHRDLAFARAVLVEI